MVDIKLLDEVKRRLVKTYNPRETYVFGSYAWGLPDEDSDLDLLVVVDELDKDRYQALVEVHRALIGLKLSKDLLLLSKEEFEHDALDSTTLHYKIKLKGKKIYAKA
jgi:uncharacterized protein